MQRPAYRDDLQAGYVRREVSSTGSSADSDPKSHAGRLDDDETTGGIWAEIRLCRPDARMAEKIADEENVLRRAVDRLSKRLPQVMRRDRAFQPCGVARR